MKNIHAFRPMLFPNDSVKPEEVKYPQLASFKLDGVRCVFLEGEMLSRYMNPINNKYLQEKYEELKLTTSKYDLIFDGELWSPDISFNELSGIIRSKSSFVPESVQFYCFEVISYGGFNSPAWKRYEYLKEISKANFKYVNFLEQEQINSAEELNLKYEEAIEKGFEGLILKSPTSHYKRGRITTASGMGYKFKPYQTFDAVIVDIEQATKVKDDVERTKDNFGHSITSRKKDDRETVEMAGSFVVEWENKILKVSLPMTVEEREQLWGDWKRNQADFRGKNIEFVGMKTGMKDVPRHPRFVRYRTDMD